jgi:hypothetical protein
MTTMRTRLDIAPLMGGFVLVAILGVPLRAWAGCEKDTDCKGDRICTAGICQDPAAAPAQPAPPYAPAPQYAPPPPQYAPPPYPPPAYPPPPPYYPPPRVYAPPPPPPDYEHLRLFLPREEYATSFLALGGVGYLPGQTASFGGISLERYWLVRMFRGAGVDGGLTFQLGEDIAFNGSGQDLAYLNAGWFGMGFDFGVTRYLQFGPRIAVGYAYEGAGTQSWLNGIVLIGGHVNLWATRSFGFYFEPDAVNAFGSSEWIPRISGGFAFRW